MIKVKFIKDHTIYKKGDMIDINKGEASYLHRLGIISVVETDECGCAKSDEGISDTIAEAPTTKEFTAKSAKKASK